MSKLADTIYLDATVKRGMLVWSLAKTIITGLLRAFNGKKVLVRIEEWSPRRSIAANNYYFGVIVESISEYTGYTKDETHAILKSMFAVETKFIMWDDVPGVIKKNGGTFAVERGSIVEEIQVPKHTRTMTKAEFAHYTDQCEQLCTDLNIRLPVYQGDKYAYYDDGRD